jgi:hypothetical protein
MRAPGQSERVTCPQCRAVLDVVGEHPALVSTQGEAPARPIVPVGTKLSLAGRELTLTGFLQRTTTDDVGLTCAWQEYLLSDDRGGQHRLVQDRDHHWSLFDTVSVGARVESVVEFDGKRYRLFRCGRARISYLEGEFSWRAEPGQATDTAELTCPPCLLIAETPGPGNPRGEPLWSQGDYLPAAEVRRALGTRDVPRPAGVAPSQPFPHRRIIPIWFAATVAVLLLGVVFHSSIRGQLVHTEVIDVAEPRQGEDGQELPPIPVRLRGGRNIRVRAVADMQNTWVELAGLFAPADEDAPTVQPFRLPIEYWSGTQDGEPWSEGDTEGGVYLSALPEGDYDLRLNVYHDRKAGIRPHRPADGADAGAFNRGDPPFVHRVTVYVEQGYPRWWDLLWACLALGVIPLVVWFLSRSFEIKRWSNSNVSPEGHAAWEGRS